MAETVVVSRTAEAAARARVAIDQAHGRVTPPEVLMIANAKPTPEPDPLDSND